MYLKILWDLFPLKYVEKFKLECDVTDIKLEWNLILLTWNKPEIQN